MSTLTGYLLATGTEAKTKQLELAQRISEGYHEVMMLTDACRNEVTGLFQKFSDVIRKDEHAKEDQAEARTYIAQIRQLLTPHITNESPTATVAKADG